jgi:Heparinase II/III-like protein/Heparinase II/III N-terminus
MNGHSAARSLVLRGRSPEELRDRGRQWLAAWSDRFSGSPTVRETTDERFAAELAAGVPADAKALHARLCAAPRPAFFAAMDDPSAVAALVRARFAGAQTRILARADRALVDRFDVLGHEGLSYGTPIDWHLDPIAGRRAPRLHWRRVPYLDASLVGDHKVTWELNRHQHLLTLGQAYWLTDDERYPATAVRHMTAWMDANAPKVGMNWSSSLEVAFRAIAWSWALHLLRGSPVLSPAFVMRALKYLNVHAHHVATHLSTYFSPNTHLTGEALGLLYVGALFPELRRSSDWRATGWQILEEQLPVHVWDDGIYFEQTTWYQRYTADFYLHALLLRERAGDVVDANTRRRIESTLDPLVHMMRPDGSTPLIGDDDGGQLAPLSPAAPGDFRATLALGAAVFGRADCAALAGPGAAIVPWMVGAAGMARYDAITPCVPAARSRAFANGGFFTARSDWSESADYLLVDCGPHGSMTCGHAHADALAFELVVAGRPVLVDPGTFSYIQPERDEFRATAAHNTVTVDGLSSSTPERPFRWSTVARCELTRWGAHEAFAFLEGSHDGYAGLPDPVRHTRAILAIFGSAVIVRDRIAARESHRIAAHFHGAAGLGAVATGSAAGFTFSDRSDPSSLALDIVALGQHVDAKMRRGRVAHAYGAAREGEECIFTVAGTGDQELVTLLVPRTQSEAAANVRELPAQRGRIVAVTRAGDEQLIGFGDGVVGENIETDASWIWVRRASGAGDTRQGAFVMIGGSRLVLDGEPAVALEAMREWVVGRVVDGRWQIEDDRRLAGVS